MLKKVILGLVVSISILNAEGQICFKLEGKLGEEIKALVEKYKGSLEAVSISNGESVNVGNVEEIMAKVEAKIEAKKIKQVEENKKEKVKQFMADGKKIFTSKCQSCHGVKAEKEAYNKSRALSSLSLEQIKTSIRGYQESSYDRGLAIMMTPYANILMEKDVEAVYEYIQTLK